MVILLCTPLKVITTDRAYAFKTVPYLHLLQVVEEASTVIPRNLKRHEFTMNEPIVMLRDLSGRRHSPDGLRLGGGGPVPRRFGQPCKKLLINLRRPTTIQVL